MARALRALRALDERSRRAVGRFLEDFLAPPLIILISKGGILSNLRFLSGNCSSDEVFGLLSIFDNFVIIHTTHTIIST